MNFYLYYLVDQSGAIDGEKTLQGQFATLADAQAKAALDGVNHYSVEQSEENEANFRIVFIQ